MNDQPKQVHPIVRFKGDLEALHERGELDMLPQTIPYAAFKNAAIVAVTDNPSILSCDRGSVFKAVRTLAAAGLVPDGREAAIVPFKGTAQAMPMVAGLIKVARNSGKIISLWSEVVYEGEEFRVWIEDGERKFEHNYDPLERGGEIRGAYAVAKLKDGSVDMEPMSRKEIEKRRKASSNQKGDNPTGIWAQWYGEMARKTVIRALCKRLPMSTEDIDRMMVEQDPVPMKDVTPERDKPTRTLAQRLQEPEEPEGPIDGEVMPEQDGPHWTEEIDTSEAFPGDDVFTEGVNAFQSGADRKTCPYSDPSVACHWLGGWDQAKAAAEK